MAVKPFLVYRRIPKYDINIDSTFDTNICTKPLPKNLLTGYRRRVDQRRSQVNRAKGPRYLRVQRVKTAFGSMW